MPAINSKKRKVSKKTKRSWRKHVDTKDVEKFLEDSRLEERLGGPFSTRQDSELFIVSTEPEVLPKRTRREILKSKEPRCFNILKPHTAVQDPIRKRNRVRTKEERKNAILVEKEAFREAQGILKLKDKIRLQNRMLAMKERSNKPKRGEFNADVWEGKFEEQLGIDTEWMSPDTVRHTLTHFGAKKRRIPISVRKKPSALPAIEAPHPGTSYNPSFEDHQTLLHQIAKKEMELIKEEQHLKRVTTDMFKKVSVEEKENNLLKEMLEGLKSEEKNDPDEDLDPTVTSVNRPVRNEKKTRVQRRKQKEEKELARKKQQKKLEKKKVSDIYKLRLLNKQLASKERKEKILREERLKKKALKAVGPKTLSKVKFEPLEADFKLANELSGNLRNAEPTTNLLKDRFKSLQQRNIVAPSRMKLKRDKAKVKRFVKPDHKIDVTIYQTEMTK
ncbi:ribosome biogenesis protein NOP53 [Osmia lignaria lignaria]|uniref:ribosome biogenesis protein NOP53 n=1 Tax=Osmia lignaria lignaria TaxID=1437193 RepID=UPI00147816C9|nr:ribosome biogenesis protein NOP53 [Osmia lignaria]